MRKSYEKTMKNYRKGSINMDDEYFKLPKFKIGTKVKGSTDYIKDDYVNKEHKQIHGIIDDNVRYIVNGKYNSGYVCYIRTNDGKLREIHQSWLEEDIDEKG